jgi:D-alanyl-D-alanine endopeptidase (penicillin-binding protein 7)
VNNPLLGGLLFLWCIASAPASALNTSTILVTTEDHTQIVSKNADIVRPIASITKLMTAMVVLDANLPMDELITITQDDVDTLRHSSSHLRVGTTLPRAEVLRLALMSSDNRAAHALARTYPGSTSEFVDTMNIKCKVLGMKHTSFSDPTGLTHHNTSTATDLTLLVNAASQYDIIKDFTTTKQYNVTVGDKQSTFKNTNRLVKDGRWDIIVSKTGYIKEAGKCLVMRVKTATETLTIILLDSKNSKTRIGDAIKVRQLAENRSL